MKSISKESVYFKDDDERLHAPVRIVDRGVAEDEAKHKNDDGRRNVRDQNAEPELKRVAQKVIDEYACRDRKRVHKEDDDEPKRAAVF